MLVFPRLSQQVVQPTPQSSSACSELFRGQLFPPLAQTDRIADQPLQQLGVSRPVAAGFVVVLGVLDVAQQVWQALLFLGADDRVVGSPEVGDQNPSELLLEKPLQGRAAAPPV